MRSLRQLQTLDAVRAVKNAGQSSHWEADEMFMAVGTRTSPPPQLTHTHIPRKQLGQWPISASYLCLETMIKDSVQSNPCVQRAGWIVGRSDLLEKLRVKDLETPEHPDKGLSCLPEEQPTRLEFPHQRLRFL